MPFHTPYTRNQLYPEPGVLWLTGFVDLGGSGEIIGVEASRGIKSVVKTDVGQYEIQAKDAPYPTTGFMLLTPFEATIGETYIMQVDIMINNTSQNNRSTLAVIDFRDPVTGNAVEPNQAGFWFMWILPTSTAFRPALPTAVGA